MHLIVLNRWRVQGAQNMLFGGSSIFIDKFRASDGDALVWVHGYGNVFEVQWVPNEQIDVEAGAWLYKDTGVQMEAVTMGPEEWPLERRRQVDLEPLHRPGRTHA